MSKKNPLPGDCPPQPFSNRQSWYKIVPVGAKFRADIHPRRLEIRPVLRMGEVALFNSELDAARAAVDALERIERARRRHHQKQKEADHAREARGQRLQPVARDDGPQHARRMPDARDWPGSRWSLEHEQEAAHRRRAVRYERNRARSRAMEEWD